MTNPSAVVKGLELMSTITFSMELPEIPLPKFNGNYMEFYGFWDTFTAIIDKEPTFTNVTKLSYLKCNCLEGQPTELIEHVPLSDKGYDEAKKLLCDQYDKPFIVRERLYQAIRNLEKSDASTCTIRNNFNQIRSHLRFLENIGGDYSSGMMASVIMSKFPEPVHMFVIGKRLDSDAELTVPFLMKTIEMYIEMKEEGELYGANCETDNCEKMESTMPSSIQSGTPTVKRVRSPMCLLCSDRHWTDSCPTYKTFEERIKAAQGKCRICLRVNHKTEKCPSVKGCPHCGDIKDHHRSLCPNLFHEVNPDGSFQSLEREPVKDTTFTDTTAVVVSNSGVEGPALHDSNGSAICNTNQKDIKLVDCAKKSACLSKEKYVIPQRRVDTLPKEKYVIPQRRDNAHEKIGNGTSCDMCGMTFANPIEHKIHSRVHVKSQQTWTTSFIARSA